MKNTFTFLNASLLVCLMLIIQGCPKKTEFDGRFVNQNGKSFKNVTIGGNNIGVVNAGTTSDYTKVPNGSGTFSGLATDSSETISGSYSITGTGKVRFSITMNAANQFTVSIDK